MCQTATIAPWSGCWLAVVSLRVKTFGRASWELSDIQVQSRDRVPTCFGGGVVSHPAKINSCLDCAEKFNTLLVELKTELTAKDKEQVCYCQCHNYKEYSMKGGVEGRVRNKTGGGYHKYLAENSSPPLQCPPPPGCFYGLPMVPPPTNPCNLFRRNRWHRCFKGVASAFPFHLERYMYVHFYHSFL